MDSLATLTSMMTQVGGGMSSGVTTALLLLFVGIITLVIGAGGLFFATDVIGRRLAAGGRQNAGPAIGLRQAADSRRWFERLFTPSGERRSATQEKMLRAGFRSSAAVPMYYTARVLLTLVAPLVVSLTLPLLLRNLNFRTVLLLMLVSAVIGFILPSAIVDRRIEQRQEAIRRGFPDSLLYTSPSPRD